MIGHTLAGLPVAVLAAERLGARAGFDIEDFHSGELPSSPRYDAERAIVTDVERRYLPRCARVTASSRGIADAIAARYGIARPHVVLNTFPLAERASSASASSASASSGSRPLSLYWYSQVIGPGRGIEDAVAAVGLLDSRVQLHLRGTLDPGFASEVVGRPNVVILPPVPPPELVARAAEHDVGLALEQPVTENRALCVTNKLFTYMLAGLAVAATDTPGQREILEEVPEAGFLYPPGRPAELAGKISGLLADPAQLARYKAAAWEAADRRFNWDRESEGLVAYLEGR